MKPRHGHRKRYLVLLVINLLFVLSGIEMIVTGATGGIPATAFFGVCAAVTVWKLWPGLLEAETRSPEDLLAQYPGPIVLQASQKKLLSLAAVSAIFGGVMLWMILHDVPPMSIRLLLWPGVVLFLGGAPVMVLVARGGSALHLSGTDLTIMQLGRSRRMRWHDVSGFAAVDVTVQRVVVFDDANSGASRTVAMNRRLIGRDAALPDNYGLDPDVLAALLEAWRALAVRNDVAG